jgi:hypothetical protein
MAVACDLSGFSPAVLGMASAGEEFAIHYSEFTRSLTTFFGMARPAAAGHWWFGKDIGALEGARDAGRAWCVGAAAGSDSNKAGMSFRFRVIELATAPSIKDSELWADGGRSGWCSRVQSLRYWTRQRQVRAMMARMVDPAVGWPAGTALRPTLPRPEMAFSDPPARLADDGGGLVRFQVEQKPTLPSEAAHGKEGIKIFLIGTKLPMSLKKKDRGRRAGETKRPFAPRSAEARREEETKAQDSAQAISSVLKSRVPLPVQDRSQWQFQISDISDGTFFSEAIPPSY